MATEGLVKLKSSQGDIFEVELKVACMSTFVRNIVADNCSDEEIPLPKISTAVLGKVISYCSFHKDNPAGVIQKPLRSSDLRECGAPEWDAEFAANTEQDEVFELILAANFLDIASLLDLMCAQVASMIKGRSAEEIRRQFNIVNDFTPEEEAQVCEENRWCEDARGGSGGPEEEKEGVRARGVCGGSASSSSTAPASSSSSSTTPPVVGQKCPNGHSLKAFSAPSGRFTCDRCQQMAREGAVLYGCRACDFDECRDCFEKSSRAQENPR